MCLVSSQKSRLEQAQISPSPTSPTTPNHPGKHPSCCSLSTFQFSAAIQGIVTQADAQCRAVGPAHFRCAILESVLAGAGTHPVKKRQRLLTSLLNEHGSASASSAMLFVPDQHTADLAWAEPVDMPDPAASLASPSGEAPAPPPRLAAVDDLLEQLSMSSMSSASSGWDVAPTAAAPTQALAAPSLPASPSSAAAPTSRCTSVPHHVLHWLVSTVSLVCAHARWARVRRSHGQAVRATRMVLLSHWPAAAQALPVLLSRAHPSLRIECVSLPAWLHAQAGLDVALADTCQVAASEAHDALDSVNAHVQTDCDDLPSALQAFYSAQQGTALQLGVRQVREHKPLTWPPHASAKAIAAAGPCLAHGVVSLVSARAQYATVALPDGGTVYIPTRLCLNRAVHGDDAWVLPVCAVTSEDIDRLSEIAGLRGQLDERPDQVSAGTWAWWPRQPEQLWAVADTCSTASSTACPTTWPVSQLDAALNNASSLGFAQRSAAGSSSSSWWGVVVGIRARASANVGAMVQPMHTLPPASSRTQVAMIANPVGSKMPRVRIHTRVPRLLAAKPVVLRIVGWDRASALPEGVVLAQLTAVPNLDDAVQHAIEAYDAGRNAEPAPEAVLCEARGVLPPSGTWTLEWEQQRCGAMSQLAIGAAERAGGVQHPALTEFGAREDTRDTLAGCLFSVDPPGCVDIDDTMSVRLLDDGALEIGVHIADVAHFVPVGSAIDSDAGARSSTLYLPHRRHNMIPAELSEAVASLHPALPKLAVSVFWKVHPSWNVHDDMPATAGVHAGAHGASTWRGKPGDVAADGAAQAAQLLPGTRVALTVIRSHAALSYQQAEDMVDGMLPRDGADDSATRPAGLEPAPESGHDTREPISSRRHVPPAAVHGLRWRLRTLTRFARWMRAARERDGALTFEGTEVRVDQTADSWALAEHHEGEIHHTIAELMLAANATVATILAAKSTAEQPALLRGHAIADAVRLARVHQFAIQAGLSPADVKFDSPRNYRASLLALQSKLDEAQFEALADVAKRALQEAQYMSVCAQGTPALLDVVRSQCARWGLAREVLGLGPARSQRDSASGPSRSALSCAHFGLALPLYTHFTSPIRRYADLVVHRQLRRALGLGIPGIPAQRGAASGSQSFSAECTAALSNVIFTVNDRTRAVRNASRACGNVFMCETLRGRLAVKPAIVTKIGKEELHARLQDVDHVVSVPLYSSDGAAIAPPGQSSVPSELVPALRLGQPGQAGLPLTAAAQEQYIQLQQLGKLAQAAPGAHWCPAADSSSTTLQVGGENVRTVRVLDQISLAVTFDGGMDARGAPQLSGHWACADQRTLGIVQSRAAPADGVAEPARACVRPSGTAGESVQCTTSLPLIQVLPEAPGSLYTGTLCLPVAAGSRSPRRSHGSVKRRLPTGPSNTGPRTHPGRRVFGMRGSGGARYTAPFVRATGSTDGADATPVPAYGQQEASGSADTEAWLQRLQLSSRDAEALPGNVRHTGSSMAGSAASLLSSSIALDAAAQSATARSQRLKAAARSSRITKQRKAGR